MNADQRRYPFGMHTKQKNVISPDMMTIAMPVMWPLDHILFNHPSTNVDTSDGTEQTKVINILNENQACSSKVDENGSRVDSEEHQWYHHDCLSCVGDQITGWTSSSPSNLFLQTY